MTNLLVVAMILLVTSVMAQNPILHWRFANAFTYDSSGYCILSFDVEMSCDVAGTYHSDIQVYFDYNTQAFGQNVVLAGNLSYERLELLQGEFAGSQIYTMFGHVDNQPYRYVLLSETMFPIPNPAFMNEVPVLPNFGGYARFRIIIQDQAELAGIEFVPKDGTVNLMNEGQFYISISSPVKTKYGNPPNYEGVYLNDLLMQPLTCTSTSLKLKAFLEGPYDIYQHNMKKDLNLNNYIPLQQPYGPALPYYGNSSPLWFYQGTEVVTSIPPDIVDWMLVELRDAPDAASAGYSASIAKQAVLLKSDGTMISASGSEWIEFSVGVNHGLFVVLWHRNHLPVMNPVPWLPGATGSIEYDFSAGEGQVYGGSGGFKELEPGIWGMIAADGNADGQVNASDKNDVWIPLSGMSGYLAGDYNLDSQSNQIDNVEFYRVNAGRSTQVPY